jgi:hypothetical protein
VKRRCVVVLTAAAGALMTIAAPANAAMTHDEYAVCNPVDAHQTMCYDLLSRYKVIDTGSGNRVWSGYAVETWTITDSSGSVTFDRTFEYKYNYLQKANSTSYQMYRYARTTSTPFRVKSARCTRTWSYRMARFGMTTTSR